MTRRILTEIEIDATPRVVWDVLTDLDGYADWNPLITEASGTVAVGEKLTNRFESPGGRAATFHPRVTVVDAERVFEWVGRLGFSALFEGRHRFELEATTDGTHLTHSEVFSGVATPLLMRKSAYLQVVEGFKALNNALKARAEAHPAKG